MCQFQWWNPGRLVSVFAQPSSISIQGPSSDCSHWGLWRPPRRSVVLRVVVLDMTQSTAKGSCKRSKVESYNWNIFRSQHLNEHEIYKQMYRHIPTHKHGHWHLSFLVGWIWELDTKEWLVNVEIVVEISWHIITQPVGLWFVHYISILFPQEMPSMKGKISPHSPDDQRLHGKFWSVHWPISTPIKQRQPAYQLQDQ